MVVAVAAGAGVAEVDALEAVVLAPKLKGELAPSGEGFFAAFALSPPKLKAGKDGAGAALDAGAADVLAGVAAAVEAGGVGAKEKGEEVVAAGFAGSVDAPPSLKPPRLNAGVGAAEAAVVLAGSLELGILKPPRLKLGGAAAGFSEDGGAAAGVVDAKEKVGAAAADFVESVAGVVDPKDGKAAFGVSGAALLAGVPKEGKAGFAASLLPNKPPPGAD